MDETLEVYDLTVEGRSLSSTDVSRLESAVEANPCDINARIKLLGFYFKIGTHKKGPRELACKHFYWFVQKMPEHKILEEPRVTFVFNGENDELFRKGVKLWAEQVSKHAHQPAVLMNASRFYFFNDWSKSIELLEAALEIEPENLSIKERIAFVCELSARSDKTGDNLRRALVIREELADPTLAGKCSRAFINLADTAYKLNDLERCRAAAERALQDGLLSDRDGDEFHRAHQLIGLVQLASNDRSGALSSLLQSGKVKSTPVLGSFGPKFDLARGLLRVGERKTVLGYLEDCSLFWKSGKVNLAFWWIQIRLGFTPALDINGHIELFLPKWLDVPADRFLSMVRHQQN